MGYKVAFKEKSNIKYTVPGYPLFWFFSMPVIESFIIKLLTLIT